MGFGWQTKLGRAWCLSLPTYEISVNGKPRKVEIAKTGEHSFTVKLDGDVFSTEISNGKIEFGRETQIKIGDKAYTVMLNEVNKTKPFEVKVENASFKVELKALQKLVPSTVKYAPSPTLEAKKPKKEVSGTITAPMTGKIVSIKVGKGEQVKAGQVLCILEAMKMENEIVAPVSGTVREVLVSEGSPVNEGDPLFVIG